MIHIDWRVKWSSPPDGLLEKSGGPRGPKNAKFNTLNELGMSAGFGGQFCVN